MTAQIHTSPAAACAAKPWTEACSRGTQRVFRFLALATAGLWLSPAFAQVTAPSITTQPQNLTVNPTGTGSLGVSATGTAPLAYRWFKGGVALTDGGDITGSTSAALRFSAATTNDSGSYYVVVSNSAGSATSQTVTVTVTPLFAPVISSATTPISAVPGAAFSYTITASNSPTLFGAAGLPAGLTLDPITGIISGQPGVEGTYSVTLSAQNAIGTGTATLAIWVQPSLPSYAGVLAVNQPAIAMSGVAIGTQIYTTDPNANLVRSARLISPAPGVGDANGTTTVFATGKESISDGVGFLKPTGLAVDAQGNVFVADTGNHLIRKITPAGAVSTVAGTVGTAGSADGVGAAARFFSPQGITVDPFGTLYVADTGNHTIRKILPDGTVSTLAGTAGVSGFSDGTASVARFNSPVAITIKGVGLLYVADQKNNAVRAVATTDGAVGTLPLQVNAPVGVTVDRLNNLFVADTNGLQEAAANGFPRGLTVGPIYSLPSVAASNASTLDPFPLLLAEYGGKNSIQGIACDSSGNLYLAESSVNGATVKEAVPYFPVSITTPPSDQAGVDGSTVTFSASVGSSATNYKWFGPNGPLTIGPVVPAMIDLGVNQPTVDVPCRSFTKDFVYLLFNSGTYTLYAYNLGSWAKATAKLVVSPAPPIIFTQPVSQSVIAGQSAVLTVSAGSHYAGYTDGLTYQWNFNGSPLLGATGASCTLANFQRENAGSYTVTVTDHPRQGVPASSLTSAAATLVLASAAAPQITGQPQSLSRTSGQSATFSITANGSPAPTYQWSFNGEPIAGATSSSYSIASVKTADSGTYQVTVTNSAGAVTSTGATLTVAPLAPTVTAQPASTRIRAGQSTTLTVAYASEGATTIQWRKNGLAIPGATGPQLTIASAAVADAGAYDAIITNASGAVTTSPAALTVDPDRVKNFSVRIVVPDNGVLIEGFVVTAPKAFLIRGAGRSLEALGVPAGTTMADPAIAIYNSAGTVVAQNDDYGSSAALQSMMTNAGAFPLASAKDAALLVTLEAGAYTVQLRGKDGKGGDVLLEMYDVDGLE